jgi:Cys-rich repeat protein
MRSAALSTLAAVFTLVALATIFVPAACAPLPPPRPRGPAAGDPRVQRPPPNAPPDPIGSTRPGDRSCTETRDCKPGDICFAPDAAPAAAAPQCQQNSQCPSGEICAAGSCTSQCTATSCGPGRTCRDGRCAPIPCTDPKGSICPQNFRCTRASRACERQACTARSQCDAGVCFHGQCFAHDAYCAPAVAPGPGSDAK